MEKLRAGNTSADSRFNEAAALVAEKQHTRTSSTPCVMRLSPQWLILAWLHPVSTRFWTEKLIGVQSKVTSLDSTAVSIVFTLINILQALCRIIRQERQKFSAKGYPIG